MSDIWKQKASYLKSELIKIGLADKSAFYYADAVSNPDVKEIKFNGMDFDILAAHSGQENVHKVFDLLKNDFNQKNFESVAFDMIYGLGKDLISNLNFTTERLSVERCRLTDNDWKKINDVITNSNIKEIQISNIKLKDEWGISYNPIFKTLVEQTPVNLEALTINDSGLINTDYMTLADKVISKRPLKKLDLSHPAIMSDGVNAVLKAIPETVTDLRLNKWNLSQSSNPAEFINTISRVKDLKRLSVMDCYLFNPIFEQTLAVLPKSLEIFDVGGNAVNQHGAEAFVAKLKEPDNRIYRSGISEKVSRTEKISGKTMSQISNLLLYTRVFYDRPEKMALAKEKLKSPVQYIAKINVKDLPENAELALLAGVFDQSVEKMKAGGIKFDKTSLTRKNIEGKNIVQQIAEMKKTSILFQPALFKSANDIQMAYNLLPDKSKLDLDGKGGRPSFIKMKNQLMIAAVKNATTRKGR